MSLFTLRVTPVEQEKIGLAYDLAIALHRNQQRDDGQPYANHLIASAFIAVKELGIFDTDIICALLLHDSVEDNPLFKISNIRAMFGNRVAKLVDTVTKPKRSDHRFHSDDERHQFHFRQVRGGDVFVKLVKLIDRLHNVRSLKACSAGKRERKIRETREVYLPLINDLRPVYPAIAQKLENKILAAIAKAV